MKGTKHTKRTKGTKQTKRTTCTNRTKQTKRTTCTEATNCTKVAKSLKTVRSHESHKIKNTHAFLIYPRFVPFFFLIIGRVFAQFTSHSIYNLIIYHYYYKNKDKQSLRNNLDYSFKTAMKMSKHDRFVAILEGIFICLGYFFITRVVLYQNDIKGTVSVH